jgi:hypothetical protein
MYPTDSFQEFGYGFFDGISGLATHPISGAKEDGAAGAIKGIAKGIGGLVVKPAAGQNEMIGILRDQVD